MQGFWILAEGSCRATWRGTSDTVIVCRQPDAALATEGMTRYPEPICIDIISGSQDVRGDDAVVDVFADSRPIWMLAIECGRLVRSFGRHSRSTAEVFGGDGDISSAHELAREVLAFYLPRVPVWIARLRWQSKGAAGAPV